MRKSTSYNENKQTITSSSRTRRVEVESTRAATLPSGGRCKVCIFESAATIVTARIEANIWATYFSPARLHRDSKRSLEKVASGADAYNGELGKRRWVRSRGRTCCSGSCAEELAILAEACETISRAPLIGLATAERRPEPTPLTKPHDKTPCSFAFCAGTVTASTTPSTTFRPKILTPPRTPLAGRAD